MPARIRTENNDTLTSRHIKSVMRSAFFPAPHQSSSSSQSFEILRVVTEMCDSPVRNKKVGTQTVHVWDTLRFTICKKIVIHNDWILATGEKHKPEWNGCFLFNFLPLKENMGKISGSKYYLRMKRKLDDSTETVF